MVRFGNFQRFGNMAGVFQVMAVAIRALDKRDADPLDMAKLTKIATAEMISSKELNADWQRAAAGVLVAIGSHLPDLMMEELFPHLSGQNSALPVMVQVLADFASADAFKCWCQACWQYGVDFPLLSLLDSDVMSLLNSAFELMFRVWATSRDLKVFASIFLFVFPGIFCEKCAHALRRNKAPGLRLKMSGVGQRNKCEGLCVEAHKRRERGAPLLHVRISTVEALGQMVGLITRTQLKSALPRLIPTILELYKRDLGIAFVATCSLHNLLNASLLSESGPPLLDFEDLTVVLSTLLPVVCINNDSQDSSDFSVGLKTYNELQHCFLTVGLVYPEDLFVFLLNVGFCPLAICLLLISLDVLYQLTLFTVWRLSEAWHSKRPSLVEVVRLLLDEQNLAVCKALSELIVVMASHCYLVGPFGELFVEYLVRHCAISDKDRNGLESSKEAVRPAGTYYVLPYRRYEVKIGVVCPIELREICEKGLLLVTITVPEMEHVLWPSLLKMIIPQVYTGAVATVCRCISELCRHRSSHSSTMLTECKARADIPNPEVLCYLAPLFPKNINLFWQDEIPKMKAYVSDTEDLKQDPSYQETWDDMIIHFLAESLDVIQDTDWVISLGNAFAKQYELYKPDDEHIALLHRCLGMLLQRVDNRAYVCDKIDWMYKQANIAYPTNRLGLAKAMGLVAASHLDTVLEKLKDILNNVGQSIFQRFLSVFSDRAKMDDSDDIHAALALMYGYAARYAPSTVIEARIDALVGTNMLSRLLHVRHPTAKQAVITAIDLLVIPKFRVASDFHVLFSTTLSESEFANSTVSSTTLCFSGRAVINAAESGTSFPLKRRDQLLDYILTLMRSDDDEDFTDSSVELLRTQALALSACTTLVSVEPKLTIETRNHVMKATLGFFSLPNDPCDVVNPLVDNLITLLCAILLTRYFLILDFIVMMDGKAPSVMCWSGNTVPYVVLWSGKVGHAENAGGGPQVQAAFVLPSRDALFLGDRVIVYLPRCADTNSEVRKVSAQILDLFFSISLSLLRPMASSSGVDIESSYTALSSLEDVIAILRRDASIDPSEVFNRVVSSVCILLTRDELVATLHGCSAAICDKVKQSAEGAIQAVVEFVIKRGNELKETDISRTTHSLLSATVHVTEKYLRQETLGAVSFRSKFRPHFDFVKICSLAENTSSKIVFNEVLAAAERDIVSKDISRLRGGWPIQDAFYAFSQHTLLSFFFLEHLISVLDQMPVLKGDLEKGDGSSHSTDGHIENDTLQAAILALTAFFRGGGKVGKKAVEQSYSSVLAVLVLQLGSCHGLARSGPQEPLRGLLTAFQAFCECVGDLEMGKILARDGEQIEKEKWIDLIGDLAGCISIKRPKEVPAMCLILSKSLNRPQRFQREAAAAAVSEFVRYSAGFESLLEQMVEAFCRHVSDDSPTVRRLCLKGLVQIPSINILRYTTEVLGVILALLDDSDDSVQLTAVTCLLMVLESSPNDPVEPILLNLSVRLRNLQICMNTKIRANAFAAFGALSSYGVGVQREAFLEQVHAALPRLVLHLHDDDLIVRQSCRNALKRIDSILEWDGMSALLSTHYFSSDHRSDYEDFVRDLTRQCIQHLASRIDTYMASVVQAYDAPWAVIQANAIYFSCCMLCLTDDQLFSASYYTQVFGMVVVKMSQSTDAIVRATCSSAVGLLLKSTNSLSWRTDRLD
ncbi:hypothetical protein RHGRI_007155 [Rhododendron griersonianum]|uniref:Condensin complex subunit 1 C-terminal domain-containing protein n=1 Tax=Rhododendron griersonianum TaxID=479676 RepID=A0AAV6KVV4_9ERIC|nr:hypothetical protein RHGRI_007155 [Rhododendron griersonianum]